MENEGVKLEGRYGATSKSHAIAELDYRSEYTRNGPTSLEGVYPFPPWKFNDFSVTQFHWIGYTAPNSYVPILLEFPTLRFP